MKNVGMPRGCHRPSPIGLWIARATLFGLFILALSQMAAWVAWYVRW